MTNCPKHPAYDGATPPHWTCRACRTVRRLWKGQTPAQRASRAKAPVATTDRVAAESLAVNGDTAEVTKTTNERVRSLDDLIRVCKIDTNEWEVERFVCNKWEVGSVPRATGNKSDGWRRDSTEPVVTELYQVKAWLKRRAHIIDARAEIASLLADAKRQIRRPAFLRRAPRRESGYMLELPITDLHVGKLAWSAETGYQNYDSKIAQGLFEEALATLVARTRSFEFEQILFVVGNDLFHADTKQGTTTAGTPLDTDSRFHKTAQRIRRMMTTAIDGLRELAPVKVVMVPGNHDTLAVWHLGESLECFYHRAKDVAIDNDPTMRKYHQHGRCMLMFAHGNRGKLADYPLLMAQERPTMWGATVHREAHTGDKHHKKTITTADTEEYNGVRVRILPALCPPDAWHSEGHFVGAMRSAEAFVWHRQQGLVATSAFTVTEPEGSR